MAFDLIEGKPRDLGGFSVRRVLPSLTHRAVGPFVFFDHLGPAVLEAGEGVQVRPHPHIGLATVTYLFEGELMHRDSLGPVQAIRPGDVSADGIGITVQTMAVFEAGRDLIIEARTSSTTILLGGARLDAPRALEWNFVASSREAIADAREAWLGYPNERFPQVPGETDFIPLPVVSRPPSTPL